MPGIFHLVSVLIYILLLYGYAKRKSRDYHVRIMRIVFYSELLLVLAIEISRKAIEQAIGIHGKHNGFPGGVLGVHIVISIITLLVLISIYFVGNKLYKGKIELKPLHVKLAYTYLVLRTLNLITSFMII